MSAVLKGRVAVVEELVYVGSLQAYAVLYGLSGRGRSSAASGPIVPMAMPLTALSGVSGRPGSRQHCGKALLQSGRHLGGGHMTRECCRR